MAAIAFCSVVSAVRALPTRLLGRALLAGSAALLAAPLAWAAPIDEETKVDPTKQVSARRPQIVIDAIELFESQKRDEAFAKLKEAKQQHDFLPPVKVMMANLFFSDKPAQPALGKMLLEQAVSDEESAKDPEAHLILGDIAFRERRVSDAELQYAEGARLVKELQSDAERKKDLQAQYWAGMAAVQQQRERWANAQKAIGEYIKLKPEDGNAHRQLASILFQLKRPEAEVVDELKAAVKLNPQIASPALVMASLYQQSKNLLGGEVANSKTEEWLNRAIKETPKIAQPYVAMGKFYWDQGNYEQAEKFVSQGQKLDPRYLDVKIFLARIARYRGNFDKAEQMLEEIVKDAPSNAEANNELALTLADRPNKSNDKRKRALNLAKLNLDADPQNPELAATLGWILLQMDQLDEAQRAFSMATQGRNLSRDNAYYLARFRHRRGSSADARKIVESALSAAGPFANKAEAEKFLKELGPTRATDKPKAEAKPAAATKASDK